MDGVFCEEVRVFAIPRMKMIAQLYLGIPEITNQVVITHLQFLRGGVTKYHSPYKIIPNRIIFVCKDFLAFFVGNVREFCTLHPQEFHRLPEINFRL
ncbi:MAG: hypothetical protein A2Y88_03710 [Chloroflexi bacterium RBG_13_48_10]|nr:MAG: hypothetical protein A2Y88_03710 [Chloroflexi bacterium RBG_13_48_10]